MTVLEKTFALWSAEPTAVALVPVDRFKPAGIYQSLGTPHVVFFPISLARYRTINAGASNALEYGLWQFSIFGESFTAADAIYRKLLSVFDGNKGGFNYLFQTMRFVDENVDVKTVHLAVDFLVTAS